jgi:hypothetical protein
LIVHTAPMNTMSNYGDHNLAGESLLMFRSLTAKPAMAWFSATLRGKNQLGSERCELFCTQKNVAYLVPNCVMTPRKDINLLKLKT